MSKVLRVLAALLLVGIAGFCAFGYLAAIGGFWPFGYLAGPDDTLEGLLVLYSIVGLGLVLLGGAGWLMWPRRLGRAAILVATLFAGTGLLCLGLAILGKAGDSFWYASTLCSFSALLTGFVGIVMFAAGLAKKRHEVTPMLLLVLAVAFGACRPQFGLAWQAYGLGGQPLLSNLCEYGGAPSLVLLMVTLVVALIAGFMARKR